MQVPPLFIIVVEHDRGIITLIEIVKGLPYLLIPLLQHFNHVGFKILILSLDLHIKLFDVEPEISI